MIADRGNIATDRGMVSGSSRVALASLEARADLRADRDRWARLDASRLHRSAGRLEPHQNGSRKRAQRNDPRQGRGRVRCLGRNLVGFGAGLNTFGKWLTKTGRSWAPLGENSEDIGGHLDELDIQSAAAGAAVRARTGPNASPAAWKGRTTQARSALLTICARVGETKDGWSGVTQIARATAIRRMSPRKPENSAVCPRQ